MSNQEKLVVVTARLAFAAPSDTAPTDVFDDANLALIPLQRREGGGALIDYAFHGNPVVSPTPVSGYNYDEGFVMPAAPSPWKFDPASHTITDTASGAAIAQLLPGAAPGCAELLVQAPASQAAAAGLLSALEDALATFDGEEDSVKEEHAEQIEEIRATIDLSKQLLAGSDSLTGHQLRAAAAALLQQAHALDGLSAYHLTHEHRFGETEYLVWAAKPPTEESAARHLHSQFEPDLGESLRISEAMSIADLTGAAHQVGTAADADVEAEEEEVTDRPAA